MLDVFNEDDYNIETDGSIKNVNGGFVFVPYRPAGRPAGV